MEREFEMIAIALIITGIKLVVTSGFNAATASILNAAEFEYYQTLEEAQLYMLAGELTKAHPRYSVAKWIILLRAIAEFQVGYPIPPTKFNPVLQTPYVEPVDYSVCDLVGDRFVQGGHFLEENVYIPLRETDRIIRYWIDIGYGFDFAYGQTNLPNPPVAMHGCLWDVYREKWMDADTGLLVFASPRRTCEGYMDCYKEFTDGRTEWPWNKGERNIKMKIGQGIYAPSFDEQICIKRNFATYHDIYRAFRECKAVNPNFPGAMEYLDAALSYKPNGNIYRIIKSAHQIYMLYYLDTAIPVSPPISPPAEEEDEKDNTVRDVAIVSALFYILRKLF